MDVRNLTFPEGTFDAVIDKGTFDCIQCGDGAGPNTEQMLKEIHDTLVPGGVYICLSYGGLDARMQYFDNRKYNWGVDHKKIPRPTLPGRDNRQYADEDRNFHWMYIMRKKDGPQRRGNEGDSSAMENAEGGAAATSM